MSLIFWFYTIVAGLFYVQMLHDHYEDGGTGYSFKEAVWSVIMSFGWFIVIATSSFNAIRCMYHGVHDDARVIMGIHGKAGSGKDTCADHLVDAHAYTKVSFADPLKEFISDVFCIPLQELYNQDSKASHREFLTGYELKTRFINGCLKFGVIEVEAERLFNMFYAAKGFDEASTTGWQSTTIRELMQLIGTDVFRTYDDHFWINQLSEKIKKIEGNVVISDVRFDNEAQAVIDLGGNNVGLVMNGDERMLHSSEQPVKMGLLTFTLDSIKGDIETLKQGISFIHNSLARG